MVLPSFQNDILYNMFKIIFFNQFQEYYVSWLTFFLYKNWYLCNLKQIVFHLFRKEYKPAEITINHAVTWFLTDGMQFCCQVGCVTAARFPRLRCFRFSFLLPAFLTLASMSSLSSSPVRAFRNSSTVCNFRRKLVFSLPRFKTHMYILEIYN